MSGETDLARMLKTLEPVLDPRRFAFASFTGLSLADAARFSPIGIFAEQEGLSLIAEEADLSGHVAPDAPRFRMISLTVHSSLEAIGLTAAISTALTGANISANVVAAHFHDHVFVPADRAEEAVSVLRSLAG